jgi:hypothetical protein
MTKLQRPHKVLLALFVILFVVWIAGINNDPEEAARAAAIQAAAPVEPERVYFQSGQSAKTDRAVSIAVDDAAWDSMMEAITAKDEIGFNQLILRGRIFAVASGTPVLVLDVGFTSYKVRVTEGPQAGRAGWVIREYLVP